MLNIKKIRKDPSRQNWYNISISEKLSEAFIREFHDYVCWKEITLFQYLSEDFIREFQDKVYWNFLICKQDFSENFKKEFKHKLYPKEIESKEKMCKEPTKYNSLEEVLSALAEGKKVRYQGWEKNCYVQIDNTHKKIRLNSGVIYSGNFNFESYLWVEYVSPALAFSELKVGNKYRRVNKERDAEVNYFKVVYVAEDYIVCENFIRNKPFILDHDQYDNFDTIKAE